MPTPQQQAFFNSNSDAMIELIERTNVLRATKNQPALIESEIDKAVDELMAQRAGDAEIGNYKFPEPPPGTPPVRQSPKVAPQSIQGRRYNFEVIKADNGFLLNGDGKSFVFKTLEELSEIFRGILFPTWADLDVALMDDDDVERVSRPVKEYMEKLTAATKRRGRPKKKVMNGE